MNYKMLEAGEITADNDEINVMNVGWRPLPIKLIGLRVPSLAYILVRRPEKVEIIL